MRHLNSLTLKRYVVVAVVLMALLLANLWILGSPFLTWLLGVSLISICISVVLKALLLGRKGIDQELGSER